ncbi:LysE family translocator [Pseudoflavonifractor sp. MSJ-37]|uniref:LysE family translocator n=1 Tax=Pseudoflavonifractor sp. MSJ-37 TaxID=2841531 RepID=UPI001C125DD5|nr:LysE family transporter [Pseudoflavonifractor sp. MSJ-37]MBU5434942.1 LysE family transporter [Pseudoflavonifractor sp. MSJ-37]
MLGYMAVSSYTPGPGNILAMETTTRFGWREGRVLIAGICTGYLCVQTLCALALYGLDTVLSPVLPVLRYLGAAYLVWLAVHMMRGSSDGGGEERRRPTFREGFLLQLVNVKIYFYIMTLLSAYLIPHIHSLPALLLAGVGVVAFGSSACLTWAFLGLKLQRACRNHQTMIDRVLGLFLLYCAWGIARS